VDKQTTPLLSWSKSFSFRSKSEAPLSDAKITTDSLIPTFLHKSAARIMSIGKSTRLLLLFEQVFWHFCHIHSFFARLIRCVCPICAAT
jgi:hypothetical protein